MTRLRPDYTNQTILASSSGSISCNHNNADEVWVIEQITVNYSNTNDSPNAVVLKNGQVFAAAAPLLPGPAGSGVQGLSQTFAQQPWLYAECSDDIEVAISSGSAGAVATIRAMYRRIGYGDDELAGRL